MKKSPEQLDIIRPKLSDPGVSVLFTLKNPSFMQEEAAIAGLNLGMTGEEEESVIRANRKNLFGALELDPEWVAFGNQVHSSRVRFVTQGGTYPETDGLVTTVPGLALAIQVADCAAVLLWDPEAKVIAGVHAGWRGAAGDIVPEALGEMRRQGAVPEQVKAFVSPCISQAHFEVGEEVAARFPEAFVDYESYRKPHVDLKGFIRRQLIEEGLKNDHIECHPGCTIEEKERFYSYRREREKSGRMLGVILILPA